MTITPHPCPFHGVYTAVVTPFTPDGAAIDFARLDDQLAFQAAGGVRGVVLAGTTGESPTLTDAEWHALMQRGIPAAKRLGLQAIAGTGSNSTAHAIDLHRAAAQLGADGSLQVNPYYNRPVQAGLERHFKAVADSAALPIMLYNIPGRTGVALSLETIEALAAHPNIRAIKDATGNVEMAGEVSARCPHLAVLSGDDPLTLPMMSLGAVGVVSVVGNLTPGPLAALVKHAADGRFAEALAIHRRLMPLVKALFIETNPIPLKCAMALLARDSGALRLPMTRASAATEARLRYVLRALETKASPVVPSPVNTAASR